MMLTGKTYDRAKFIVQIFLPAFAALYFGLASTWGLPSAEQVVGTCAVLATFLGAILQISSKNYENSEAAYDGEVVVKELDTGEKTFSLKADLTPEEIQELSSIRFKVHKDDVT